MVTWFDPPPADLPDRVPSPFAMPPHSLAVRAIAELRAALPALPEGKMFGVLVVERAGRVGYLRAFSGMLGGTWFVDGYAPPVFDYDRREAFWPAGEAEMAAFDQMLVEIEDRAIVVRSALAELDERHRTALAVLDGDHAENKAARHAARATADAAMLKHLARESQQDGAERKRVLAAQRAEREPMIARLRGIDDERRATEARKAARSRELLVAIHETYVLANARGERKPLRDIFAPAEPPGGAGDCAAPKLLAQAYREGLRPVAFAEVWCGPPSPTGDRHDGTLYPACRGKCGPVLSHALTGLSTDALPIFGLPVNTDPLRVVFEDDWIVVVDKPVGLLSVPGRGEQLRDCVQSRLREHHPELLLAHRLDLDTSGLVIAAKDLATYGALQRLFEERRIDKRYIAWVSRALDGEGVIELPLRVDVDDRPRQIVDRVHGKPAVTTWRVLERTADRTRVALSPRTGRTHQLRVHAAHPDGLDAPIVGDRLYSRIPHDEPRLLLHAEALTFAHPRTSALITLTSKAPF